MSRDTTLLESLLATLVFTPKKRPNARSGRKLTFESLEIRELLSVNPLQPNTSETEWVAPLTTPLTTPTAPENVTLTAVSPTAVLLTWDASPGATHYKINCYDLYNERWTNVSETVHGTYFTVNGLLADHAYLFSVHAINAAGTSSGTNTPYIARDGVAFPNRVGSVAVAQTSPNSAQITWSAVENACYYRVNLFDSSTNSWKLVGHNITGTSLNVENLLTERFYKVSVHAYNASGLAEGTHSELFAVAPTKLPEPPTAVVFTTFSPTSGRLTWNASPDATSYKINCYDLQADRWTTLYQSTTATSIDVSDLLADHAYKFAVHAINAIGTSEGTNTPYIARDGVAAPLRVSHVTAASHSPGTATLTWTGVGNATAYKITCYDVAERRWFTVASQMTGTDFVVEGLESGREYKFSVSATNPAGIADGTHSDVVWIDDAPAATVPDVPDLNAVALPEGRVELSWNAVADAVGYVLWRKHSGGEWTLVAESVTGTTFTDGPLAAGDYTYGICAFKASDLFSDRAETTVTVVRQMDERPNIRVETIRDGVAGREPALVRFYRSTTEGSLAVFYRIDHLDPARAELFESTTGTVLFEDAQAYVDIEIGLKNEASPASSFTFDLVVAEHDASYTVAADGATKINMVVLPRKTPKAQNDVFRFTYTGDAVTGNVLANDLDADFGNDVGNSNGTGNADRFLEAGYRVELLSGPANGALLLGADGTFSYVPVNAASRQTRFTYRIVGPDGFTGAAATVTLLFVPDANNGTELPPGVAMPDHSGATEIELPYDPAREFVPVVEGNIDVSETTSGAFVDEYVDENGALTPLYGEEYVTTGIVTTYESADNWTYTETVTYGFVVTAPDRIRTQAAPSFSRSSTVPTPKMRPRSAEAVPTPTP